MIRDPLTKIAECLLLGFGIYPEISIYYHFIVWLSNSCRSMTSDSFLPPRM